MVDELKGYLQKEGFIVNLIGGQCPFQIEANHKSGISIYLRSRGHTATLEIYDEHYDEFLPDDNCIIWQDFFECWEEYEAGYIDFPEAFYVFHALWSDAKEILG